MVLVPTVVQAQPVHDGNFIDNVQIALLNEAKGRGYTVNTISDLTVGTGILENTSTSPEALAQEIADVFFPVRNTSSDSLEISERSFRQYTAKVFAGVPLLGACNIYQDFEATVSQYKVRSYKLLGGSYVSGVCLFAWSHNRNWAEKVGREFHINMKGTASAVVKGAPVSFNPTFMAIFDVRENDLQQHVQ